MTSRRHAVGLCGCGNMGSALGARLVSGAELIVYDIEPERRESLAAQLDVVAVASVAELARETHVVVLSLPNLTASRQVVLELSEHATAGTVIIETSTLNPRDVVELGSTCASASVRLVDAAILSGVGQMASGTSMLLIGGSDEDVRAAQPVLDLLSERQLRLGPLGSGMAAKVANNAVSHAVMVVLLEAAAIAVAAGVPLDRFGEILSEPDAGLTRPLHHRLLERVMTGSYDGGMPTEAARKDSRIALQLAQTEGIPLFAIQAAHTPYELAIAAGYGREDYAALAKLWETWTGRPLGGGEPARST